ncbi:hypothetical protein GLOTRDRAFT_125865 [Gloeophyllum trabeum ATCC 11539]|uniref:Uncharacterized protein n=1 Tax=Gloeophyllum trabeum (strain ATCC 11539 / FP-39264 / Madison 617) TaxID=670483 RepID=S7S1E5_GLOTA|nr:uncharacterized protein GLOTRDRAFT_125865 [Gloeophyllum trabeum ATCC 11539]EPQ59564.1 hypothetical protein GLOTRDRAFT_125865 [Gloeophyllum trabeum ATCC 11539]
MSRLSSLSSRTLASTARRYSTHDASSAKTKSPHAQWYADVVPAMIPVAILGSAVYLSLRLAQNHLAHEKYLDEARARVRELEAEVDALREARLRKHDHTPSTSSLSPRRWFSWG